MNDSHAEQCIDCHDGTIGRYATISNTSVVLTFCQEHKNERIEKNLNKESDFTKLVIWEIKS